MFSFSPRKKELPFSMAILVVVVVVSFPLFIAFTERKKKVPFSMAIGNWEHMQECFSKHLRMGTARMKKDKRNRQRR